MRDLAAITMMVVVLCSTPALCSDERTPPPTLGWKSAFGIPLVVVGGAGVVVGVGTMIAGAATTGDPPDPNQGVFTFIIGSLVFSVGGLANIGGIELVRSDLNDAE